MGDGDLSLSLSLSLSPRGGVVWVWEGGSVRKRDGVGWGPVLEKGMIWVRGGCFMFLASRNITILFPISYFVTSKTVYII